MRAALRRLHSPDVPDLEGYIPADDTDVGFLVQALVGPEGDPGEESFDFLVCTPRWFAAHLGDRYLFGRHYLFLPQYHYATMLTAIKDVCERVEGSDWPIIASHIARYGRWEFEDYSPA